MRESCGSGRCEAACSVIQLAKALSPLVGSVCLGGISNKQSEMQQAICKNGTGPFDVSCFVGQVGQGSVEPKNFGAYWRRVGL